ncbi:MAG TPA: hypothetical protein VF559_07470 [Caulobacteraceae bacterium]|jgi:Ca2+-binding RTX toxin-like protein
MPTAYVNSTVQTTVTDANAYTTAANQSLYLGAAGELLALGDGVGAGLVFAGVDQLATIHGRIYSDGGNGINLYGEGSSVVCYGQITAGNAGVRLLQANDVTVMSGGEIYGDAYGAYLEEAATNSEILNYGSITGGSYGMLVYAAGADIQNFGTISGVQSQAIFLLSDSISVYNAGDIQGGITSAGELNCSVTNTGLIVGDVASYGHILVYNSGEITGGVFTADGDDLDVIKNSGVIQGMVGTGLGADRIINTGSLNYGVVLGDGNDLLDTRFGRVVDTIDAGNGDDRVLGGDGADIVVGFNGADLLKGFGGEDDLSGGEGKDTLAGGLGDDLLTGGRNADRLVGGDGADTFTFTSTLDSTAGLANRDTIVDFSRAEEDEIDLGLTDANNTLAGNQAFAFIGTAAFGNVAGQLRYSVVEGNALLEGDINGDGTADFGVLLLKVTNLEAADFVL